MPRRSDSIDTFVVPVHTRQFLGSDGIGIDAVLHHYSAVPPGARVGARLKEIRRDFGAGTSFGISCECLAARYPAAKRWRAMARRRVREANTDIRVGNHLLEVGDDVFRIGSGNRTHVENHVGRARNDVAAETGPFTMTGAMVFRMMACISGSLLIHDQPLRWLPCRYKMQRRLIVGGERRRRRPGEGR